MIEQPPNETPQGPRWTVRLVLLAITLAALALFVAENFSVVEVRLWVIRERTRLAWVILIASALGFAVGYLTAAWRRRSATSKT